MNEPSWVIPSALSMHHGEQGPVIPEEARGRFLSIMQLWLDWGTERLAWVMAPYRDFRLQGGLQRRSEAEFTSVVSYVEHRIWDVLAGRGGTTTLDTSWETIKPGSGWLMVRETGSQARIGMYASGVRAFISCRARQGPRDPTRHDYVVGRMSEFIPFPVGRVLMALSETEPEAVWGGGSSEMTNIGGSHRVLGSSLPPEQVFEIVESLLTRGSS